MFPFKSEVMNFPIPQLFKFICSELIWLAFYSQSYASHSSIYLRPVSSSPPSPPSPSGFCSSIAFYSAFSSGFYCYLAAYSPSYLGLGLLACSKIVLITSRIKLFKSSERISGSSSLILIMMVIYLRRSSSFEQVEAIFYWKYPINFSLMFFDIFKAETIFSNL